MGHWGEEFIHLLHSREGSCTRGPRDKQKDRLLQVDVTSHGQQAESRALGVQDSREFILHVRSAIYTCKQMEHDVKSSSAEEVVATALLDLEIKKEEYAQVRSSGRKKNKGNSGESIHAAFQSLVAAKSAHKKSKTGCRCCEACRYNGRSEGLQTLWKSIIR